jgi:hypothetical protein
MSHESFTFTPPRPLLAQERALLDRLVAWAGEEWTGLYAQAERAHVSESCSQCPTFFLSLGAWSHDLATQVAARATGDDADGIRLDVQLHVEGGLLRQVEATREDGATFVAPIDIAALRKSL